MNLETQNTLLGICFFPSLDSSGVASYWGLFCSEGKWKWSRSVMSNSFATPWTVAHQAPPSMGFSRQEYWSGLPFLSPGDLSDPAIEPGFPALQADALPSEPPGNPYSEGKLTFKWFFFFFLPHSEDRISQYSHPKSSGWLLLQNLVTLKSNPEAEEMKWFCRLKKKKKLQKVPSDN